MKFVKKHPIFTTCVAILACYMLLLNAFRATIVLTDSETGRVYARLKTTATTIFSFHVDTVEDGRNVSYPFTGTDEYVYISPLAEGHPYDEVPFIIGEVCTIYYQIPNFDDGYRYANKDLVALCGEGTKILISTK
jgi:hypothetical protein